jgi:flagellar basal-body rod modification protein FlgD
MVDAVSNNGIGGSLSALAGGGATKDVDFNTFLKLLVTQLQNQDPLNPMEGTEFTGQIAQFSQLEQQIAGNSHLEELASARNYSEQAVAVSYIGKEVLAPSRADFSKVSEVSVDLAEGGEIDFAYELEEAAETVVVEIRNAEGDLVRTISGDKGAGIHGVTWDGLDGDEAAVPAGSYKIAISAADDEGGLISNRVYSYQEVAEVAGDNSGLILSFVGGKQALFDQVISVRGGNNNNDV